jgi:hypothetical protein
MDSIRPAIDSCAATHFSEALQDCIYADEWLREQQVALVRIFLALGTFYQLPSVEKEFRQIKDSLKGKSHQQFADAVAIDIAERGTTSFENCVGIREKEYLKQHPKELDCRIAAEAACGECNWLLTDDKDLVKNLGGCMEALTVAHPNTLWKWMEQERNPITQRLVFSEGHPLAHKTWWKW